MYYCPLIPIIEFEIGLKSSETESIMPADAAIDMQAKYSTSHRDVSTKYQVHKKQYNP